MLTCKDVAEYFLSLNDEDAGDLISNLKLQKLVYYAQGFHLALSGKPLFAERIEAWTHGPVCPDLYREYRVHGGNPIPRPAEIDFDKYGAETRELLDEVYHVYGQYSAWKLRNMTHEEAPWKDASPGETISHESLREYFRTQLA
jgi:uncharacterized phage-associated protein